MRICKRVMGGTYLCWSISDRKKPAVDGWSKKCQQLGHGRRLLWWWGHPDLTPPLRKCFTDKKSVFLFQKFDFIHSLCPHTAEESHHQEMQRNCGGGKSKRFLSKIAHLSETKYELWQRERGVNSPNTTSGDHEMLLIVFVFWGGPLPSLSIQWVWNLVLRGCASSPSLIYGSLFLH